MREEEEPEPEPSMSEDDDATDLDLVRSNRTRASTDSPSSSSSSSSSSSCYPPDQVLENVLENVLRFLTCRTDRNAASLVCKSWKKAEAMSRTELFIGNCYSISPQMVINRFRSIKSVILKGKPRFADFNLVPPNWGAHFSPWISAMAPAYLGLEKLLLKRMSVTDHDLSLLAHSLPCFRELVLVCCEGFGTVGIAIIASKCRQLRVLDLIEDDVIEEDDEIDWLSCFPETITCLESLSFDCLDSPVNFDALEGLVARSPLLKKLRVSRNVSIGQLQRLLLRAPQLTHLGTGSFNLDNNAQDQELDLTAAFTTCKSLSCLSGFKEILLDYLPSIYPVCCNLTSLNFSYANISSQDLQGVIVHCHKLQNLWVLDSVGDEGLQAVAATCKDLVELRVFPLDVREDSEGQVSEVGFVAISEGCRKLRSILYFCQHMTNAAVITMSRNCQELVVFRLCIMDRHRPDHVTGEPMDEGFGAIVMNCKKLTRLAISGLLTDSAFAYIGRYGKLVRTLSVAFAGNSDMALKYVLDGCSRLQKLEIRDSPFGDSGLLSGLHHYYNMRFLWMSSCRLTPGGCKDLARRMPRLVVEVIRDGEDGQGDKDLVDKFYMYRSLAGPRDDTPQFVSIL